MAYVWRLDKSIFGKMNFDINIILLNDAICQLLRGEIQLWNHNKARLPLMINSWTNLTGLFFGGEIWLTISFFGCLCLKIFRHVFEQWPSLILTYLPKWAKTISKWFDFLPSLWKVQDAIERANTWAIFGQSWATRAICFPEWKWYLERKITSNIHMDLYKQTYLAKMY